MVLGICACCVAQCMYRGTLLEPNNPSVTVSGCELRRKGDMQYDARESPSHVDMRWSIVTIGSNTPPRYDTSGIEM